MEEEESRWQRVRDPIAAKMKGRALTLNGKALSVDTVAKLAARVVGGLLAGPLSVPSFPR